MLSPSGLLFAALPMRNHPLAPEFLLLGTRPGGDGPAWEPEDSVGWTLMMALDRHIRTKGWTQAEAARRLGVTQPRISDLLRGKIPLFSIDTLVGMLTEAGLRVEMRVGEAA